jgi:predicted small secreted protein
MKGFIGLIAMVFTLAACNNGGTGKGVGDSLSVDPTTAQPITTEPDTVGTNNSDSLSINQNQ